jgi:hypothetical protein
VGRLLTSAGAPTNCCDTSCSTMPGCSSTAAVANVEMVGDWGSGEGPEFAQGTGSLIEICPLRKAATVVLLWCAGRSSREGSPGCTTMVGAGGYIEQPSGIGKFPKDKFNYATERDIKPRNNRKLPCNSWRGSSGLAFETGKIICQVW